jgi:hypothetical protein
MLAKKNVRYHDFESDHQTFNAKARTYGVSSGNVCSGTQNSTYVRSHSETECNGATRPPGHLRAFDLEVFKGQIALPHEVRTWLNVNRENKCIVYCLRTYRGEQVRVHGWIITGPDPDHKLLASFAGRGQKNRSVVDEAIRFLAGNSKHFAVDVICNSEAEVREKYEGAQLKLALANWRLKKKSAGH